MTPPTVRKRCPTKIYIQLQRVTLTLLLFAIPSWPQDSGLVAKMAANEVTARQHQAHFAYTSEERSTRTGSHLWKENVVEIADGPLRRLIAIDGQPLTAGQAQAEQQRIDNLVAHPGDLRKLNQAHKDDEARATQLLQLLSTAFVLAPNGEVDGCTSFTFQPNPSFQPASYQERVAREMAGTVSLKQPEFRLCTLNAKIMRPVEFGFGMLGHIDQGGHFSLERKQLDAQNWKSDRIAVHVTGKILLLKSLAQDQEAVRTDIRVVPESLTLQQAAQMTLQEPRPDSSLH
jgi:hypothetical protein